MFTKYLFPTAKDLDMQRLTVEEIAEIMRPNGPVDEGTESLSEFAGEIWKIFESSNLGDRD